MLKLLTFVVTAAPARVLQIIPRCRWGLRHQRIPPADEPRPQLPSSRRSCLQANPCALLLRFGCWSGGQIGVVGIDNTLPLPVRLLLPDLDEFAGITDWRSAFRILDREQVGSVKISELTG